MGFSCLVQMNDLRAVLMTAKNKKKQAFQNVLEQP